MEEADVAIEGKEVVARLQSYDSLLHSFAGLKAEWTGRN
jgi:hypothetical protein